MNVIVSASALVVIIVAIDVLAAMRPGVTPWLQFPLWIGVAMAAFITMLGSRHVEWPEAMLIGSMAGFMWRFRGALVDQATPRPHAGQPAE